MDKDYLQSELQQIHQWEKEQEDIWFWEKLGKIPFAILDKLTPTFLHQKIDKILEEVTSYIHNGGRYLIKKESILSKFEQISSLEEVQHLHLSKMDKAADSIISSRKQFATAQGATTGFGGLFTLAIDIPAVLGMSLKVLQEIAVCYGYDPFDEKERVFIIKCLQFSSSDLVGKQTILEEIKDFNHGQQRNNSVSQVQSWREVMTVYRDNYGWKKLFQMVPVAGMVFGAYLNRKTIEDVSEVGKMLYKKRRILELLENE